MELSEKLDRFYGDEAVRAAFLKGLAGLIAIPSVSAAAEGEFVFGRESARAIGYVLDYACGLGFETENHDWYCGSVVLPGDGPDEIGIVGHVDVVPAFGDWEYPKYELTVDGDLLIGRGVGDDKGPVAAALAAMTFFKESGIRLPFSVRLIVGGSEETGMGDLPHYLALGKPVPKFSFTPDSSFPVCRAEKGICAFDAVFGGIGGDLISFRGGSVSNAVADSAEAVLDLPADTPYPAAEGIRTGEENGRLKVCAAGRSAHAAMPEGSINAVVRLAAFLLDSGLVRDERTARVLRYCREANADTAGTGMGIACADELTGPLTCITGMARTEDGAFVVNHNVRYPVSLSFADELLPKLKASCEAWGAALRIREQSDGYAFPPDAPEIRALCRAYTEVTGIEAEAYTMGGGTYARAFPNTVAFGAEMGESPFGPFRGNAHQNDECVRFSDLWTASRVYAVALARLAELG